MFETVHSQSFLDDLVILPRATSKRIPAVVRAIRQDPYRAQNQAGRCLKGHYDNLYRVRLGKYRLLYSVGDGCVRLLAVGPRDRIYDRFRPGRSVTARIVPTLPGRDPSGDLPDGEENPVDAGGVAGDHGPPLLRALLDSWGVPRRFHDRICACQSPDDVFSLDIPGSVKSRVLHWHQPTAGEQVVDEPGFELQDPDDLDLYAEGRLKRFLLRLDPEQERAASRGLTGPALVKGGPGTGKSLVALYRIRNLLEDGQQSLLGDGEPTALLVTYTNSLVRASRELLEQLLGDRTGRAPVSSLDRIVREIVTGAGEQYSPADRKTLEENLSRAIDEITESSSPTPGMDRASRLSPGYLIEEFKWVIEGRPISTLAEYLEEDRSGRGVRFDSAVRRAVWDIHQKLLEKLRQSGQDTFERYRRRALEILRTDPSLPRYDAVVVDEAQDLTPVGLLLCMELARSPAGFYMTADASQSIYSKGLPWLAVDRHLDVRGRTTILRYNYRSTKAITAAARDVLAEGADIDTANSIPVREGARPLLVECDGLDEQAYAAGLIIARETRRLHLPPGAGAVLVRSNRLAEDLASRLATYDLRARAVPSAEFTLGDDEIKVMTLHAAKGLEFPVVVIAGVDRGRMPVVSARAESGEREEQLAEERRLLFVGLSRAMRSLALTYTASRPSPFIAGLNTDLWRQVRAEHIASS